MEEPLPLRGNADQRLALLSTLFQEVADLVRESPPDEQVALNDTRLRLYGLYKRVKDGPCLDKDNNDAPSRLQVVARAKYKSWVACSSLLKEQAMMEYVELVSSLDSDVGRQCMDRMDVWKRANESLEMVSDDRSAIEQDKEKPKQVCQVSYKDSSSSYMADCLGFRPMVPHRQLDISYTDLCFAALQCFKRNSMSRYSQLEEDISKIWTSHNQNVVVGLSVRSLLDLYLRAMSYPKGSQVIVAPAINIPGMMDVMRHHDIEIVPVDMMEDAVRVDCLAVQKAVSDNSVAIMIVHPFGQCSTTQEDMETLRNIANSHCLQLWDDKSECFAGVQYTMLDSKADLSFLSFGTIKTSTALGSGLAFVRNQDLADKMKRLHCSLYPSQSTSSYFVTVMACTLMKCILEHPLLYGLIFTICQCIGLDLDSLVTAHASLRASHTANDPKNRRTMMEPPVKSHYCLQMRINHIRSRPSVALLSLLHRRLSQNLTECSMARARIKRSQVMAKFLCDMAPPVSQIIGIDGMPSTWWLFPVCVQDPESVCCLLRDKGWGVTSGSSSQLQCVANYSSSDADCPRIHKLMESIVYLPIAGVPMTTRTMRRLACDVGAASAQSSLLPSSWSFRMKASRFWWLPLLLSLSFLMVMTLGTSFLLKVLGNLVCFAALCCTVVAFVAVLVRHSVADLYVNGSRSFAKYNKLLYREEEMDKERNENSSPKLSLLGMKALTLSTPDSTLGRDGWSKVVLTGATGFVGSMVLRDLLLHRDSLKIEGVILLCRSKRDRSAACRVTKLLDNAMFNFLTTQQKTTLVHVLDADLTKARAGLTEEDYSWICNEKEISHVIHCAASVSFNLSLRDAATSNISSALNMQRLAADFRDSLAQYVFISTCFVHGDSTGTSESPLLERLHSLRGYDPYEIYSSMLGAQFYASSAMADLGFPNTYTFSKCVAEHLIFRDRSVSTIIIRPSIVSPAIEQPYEGWAGNCPSTIVAASCLYLSYRWNPWCFGSHRVPYIPVDVVARFILVKAFAQKHGVGSSLPLSASDHAFGKYRLSGESLEPIDKESLHEGACCEIYNASWDSESPASSGFSWVDHAIALLHVGAVKGYFSRFTAYIRLFVYVQWFPYFGLNFESYAYVHKIFVLLPLECLSWAATCIGWCPKWLKDLSRLSPFLDLPLLFYPFMNNDFFFRSELVAPECINGERYLFLCAASAVRFIESARTERSDAGQLDGGGFCRQGSVLPINTVSNGALSDIWWTITKPKGGVVIRLAGWAFRMILRACSVSLTVDVASFSALAQESSRRRVGGHPTHIVLAPTHRSFFDFMLLSYIAFELPELGLEIPYIAAADDFLMIPLIGWAARMCKAFFLRRGRGMADPELREAISAIKAREGGRGACIEVFVEGTRSRDRRFIPAKTGLLRCLVETGGDHFICPIVISYETVPEESVFLKETGSGSRGSLNLHGLLRWLKDVYLGRVAIGKIHVAASPPLLLKTGVSVDYSKLVQDIQKAHQDNTFVSQFHIQSVSEVLDLNEDTVQEALETVGCKQWPAGHPPKQELKIAATPVKQWLSLFHVSHFLAPCIAETHPTWSQWLDQVSVDRSFQCDDSHCVKILIDSMLKVFDHVDAAVEVTMNDLRDRGFEEPSIEHVTTITSRRESKLPLQLIRAAVAFRAKTYANVSEVRASGTLVAEHEVQKPSDSEESLGSWGFADSGFILCKTRGRALQVVMKGSRYDICGQSLPHLVPFIEKETGVRMQPLNAASSMHVDLSSVSTDMSQDDIDHLHQVIPKISTEPVDLARHGTGHSQEDVYLLRFGDIDAIRLPDAVAWPSSEDEVVALVKLAKMRSWCLIPHGGGTNVSNATRCPSKEIEPRPIISVDMKLMNRILWLNEEDGLAHVESGITGKELVEQLGQRGYTMGHEPDSLEFSTLGGWIATKASGMKRSKYGNIEDIVKTVGAIGSDGRLWRGSGPDDCHSVGRESRGLDLCSLMLGSEGCFGIITSAVIRVWPHPECKDFESVILPGFDDGVRFMRELARLESNLPASVRLLDNEQFRLGQALRPEANGLKAFVDTMKKMAMTTLLSCSPDRIVCATIVFEGSRDEVRTQRRLVEKAAAAHGGTLAGPKIGRAGYQLTFAIAYLRDFAMTYSLLGESFETFAPWSKLQTIVSQTKGRIRREHEERCLPGFPFIGCRVTQLYHEGACLYFYFCMNVHGVKDPSTVFSQLEHAAREEILSLGGSLSHHHGIGKKRAGFAREMDSESFRSSVNAWKEALDPSNVFGARNGSISRGE